ncbi:hypothetical protein ElyMa_001560200 [Elysia marginata]|uniref:Uncharacterized protein n=1 Tax=Elysia marginata TaxID=1093978 RepID=A0AAV4JHJ1_9GAST|nr:hypothetical protein ElyMa_001560200 [Elysia marginata]
MEEWREKVEEVERGRRGEFGVKTGGVAHLHVCVFLLWDSLNTKVSIHNMLADWTNQSGPGAMLWCPVVTRQQ